MCSLSAPGATLGVRPGLGPPCRFGGAGGSVGATGQFLPIGRKAVVYGKVREVQSPFEVKTVAWTHYCAARRFFVQHRVNVQSPCGAFSPTRSTWGVPLPGEAHEGPAPGDHRSGHV